MTSLQPLVGCLSNVFLISSKLVLSVILLSKKGSSKGQACFKDLGLPFAPGRRVRESLEKGLCISEWVCRENKVIERRQSLLKTSQKTDRWGMEEGIEVGALDTPDCCLQSKEGIRRNVEWSMMKNLMRVCSNGMG